MTDISTLHGRAAEVRAYLCGNLAGQHLRILRSFPSGCCKVASLLLLQWLHDKEGVRDGFGVAWARRPNPRTPGTDATHFWLEVGGVIIDITADQFDDCGESVHVSQDRDWHDTFSGSSRFPQHELTPLTGEYMREYQAMVAHLDRADNPPVDHSAGTTRASR